MCVHFMYVEKERKRACARERAKERASEESRERAHACERHRVAVTYLLEFTCILP